MFKKIIDYFTKGELCLWSLSVSFITISFFAFGGKSVLTLIASLIGVTAILFNAKGNPIGQALMIIFSIVYGVISYSFSYYGEMLTYLLMTLPMAVFALVSWLKNPYDGNRAEVKVNSVSKKETAVVFVAAGAVTAMFYFVLKYFDTANIIPSTASVTTSFLAVYLTFRRSPYFNLAYALNDAVLIVLWIFASLVDREYVSVVVCFCAFLLNDVYGFFSWRKRKEKQNVDAEMRKTGKSPDNETQKEEKSENVAKIS